MIRRPRDILTDKPTIFMRENAGFLNKFRMEVRKILLIITKSLFGS
jgi:hypothetical protein